MSTYILQIPIKKSTGNVSLASYTSLEAGAEVFLKYDHSKGDLDMLAVYGFVPELNRMGRSYELVVGVKSTVLSR